ncbi:hypothetical protein PV328_004296 [Microctonus aethiopoides]|uniref:Uncharacterized protein n=1 Tax=Microctonus aethiopoides TaxID=144406 RepID=A0AA39FA90_9HYME|nr:hypothetical protein PV328_004296 [Microctonus aethiopoides]
MFSYKLYPLLILVLISPCFENANAGAIYIERSRRSFFHYLDCPKSGEYNSEQIKIIARLDKVCEDCYYLYHERYIYTHCRKKCFSNEYFLACAETLRMDGDELEKLKQSVRTLRSYSVS